MNRGGHKLVLPVVMVLEGKETKILSTKFTELVRTGLHTEGGKTTLRSVAVHFVNIIREVCAAQNQKTQVRVCDV